MAHDWVRCVALSERLVDAACDYDRPGSISPWNISDAFGHVAGVYENLGVPPAFIAQRLRSVADVYEQLADQAVEDRRSQLHVVED